MARNVKNEERIRQIYETALNLFAKHGYRKTSVVDIANELGMVKGNLYLYALNKQDLYEKAINN
jgi:AcrR family transcriptional regulator